MKGLLSANLRAHGKRYTATSIAILLATTFILLCFGVAGGFAYSMKMSVAAEVDGAQGVVTEILMDSDEADTGTKALEALRNDPKIDYVEPLYSGNWRVLKPEQDGEASTIAAMRFDEIRPEPFKQVKLIDGRLPEKTGEITLSEADANTLSATIGDTVYEEVYAWMDDSGVEAQSFKVVGITETPTGLSLPTSFVPHGKITELFPGTQPDAILFATKGMSDKQASEHVKDVVKEFDLADSVKTNDEYVKDQMSQVSASLASMLVVVLVFPGIAAITAIIVISTTFQVMLTQRQRELALLRSIGADSKQIRRLMLKENLLVGLISSALGIVLGTVLAVIVNKGSELTPTNLAAFEAIPWWGYVATLISGLIITLAAGLRPALRASRLSPMVALQPVESQQVAQKRRTARMVTGIVVTLVGVIILAITFLSDGFGDNEGLFFFAFLGGAISFFGVLTLMTWLLPYITRGVGNLFGRKSITMQVAGENTWRNPARTGATGTALILGLTLVVMMMVGARSMQTTVTTEIDQKRPIDVTVQMRQPRQLSEEELKKISSVENVAQVIEVPSFIFENEGEVYTINEGRELSGVAHSPLMAPKRGTIAVNGWLWDEDVKTMSFTVDGKTFEFATEVAPTEALTLSPDDFKALRDALGDQAVDSTVLYIRIADDLGTTEVDKVNSDIRAVANDVLLGGSAKERAMMMTSIKSLLIATVVMLGVSIVVALVGVANTLALSVSERRRENGLLRALGMTRGNIRAMITWETLLIGGMSVLIGIALGIGYGILGLEAIPFGEDVNRVIAIPWGQVALAAAIAIGSALLASILPARSAAKVPPVEALAAIE